MHKTLKKAFVLLSFVLGIFSADFSYAQINRYDCSRFNQQKGQCTLSLKCTWDDSSNQCVVKNEDKAANKTTQFEAEQECEKLESASARRKCRAAAKDNYQVDKNCDKISNTTIKGKCNNDTLLSSDCENANLNLSGSDKRNCKDAVRNIEQSVSKSSDSAAAEAEYEDFEQFGTYTGPTFGGPGLRAGSRIAKQKLDNTISKERSLKNLIIGWTQFALSITAVLAVVALVWAGVLYVTDMGDGSNSEKAKKIMLYVGIGIIVILGSYAIVNTLMNARFGNVTTYYEKNPRIFSLQNSNQFSDILFVNKNKA